MALKSVFTNKLSLQPVPSQLVKMAKRLKKEKVNVDIINFGEEVRVIPEKCKYFRPNLFTFLQY